jgi:nucleoside-diphosphate-sugar epimerase
LVRFLITGASGFVGSRLAIAAANRGDDVAVMIRPTSSLNELAPVVGRIAVHRLEEDLSNLGAVLDEAKPDVVFHLATYFVVPHTAAQIQPMIDAALSFPTRLVEAMVERGVRRLVNTGTSWQYYHSDVYRAVCLHAALKQAFDDILAFYCDEQDLKVVTLKLYDTYGPGDPRKKLFALLVRLLEASEPFAISPGEQLVDLVHVDDVVAAFLAAGERLLSGAVDGLESYAVSSGDPRSLRDIVSTFEGVVGKTLPIQWGARPYRPREVMVPWTGGLPIPGWRPLVGLEAGIIEVLGLKPAG